ncbi:Single-stranded-DNA-specific exonuclease RecJ [compost metagenome]
MWGQGFAAPTFHDDFHIVSQRVVGDKHLKLRLEKDGVQCDGMLFNQVEWLPQTINAVYQLAANEWQGRKELQIYIQHWRQPG